MARTYTSTTFSHGKYPTSQDMTSFNSRISRSFHLFADAIAEMLHDNAVIDSTSVALDKVITFDNTETLYTDREIQAYTGQTPHWPTFTVTTSDRIYFGFSDVFLGLAFTFSSVAGGDITDTWFYYDGSSFTSLTLATDGTASFTQDGSVTWADPGDWSMEDLDTILSISGTDSIDRYWVYVNVGAAQDFKIDKVVMIATVSNELEVVPADPASMAIIVEPGYALVSGDLVSVDSRSQLSVTAPGSNSRYTIIQLSNLGVLSIKNGTAAASPVVPTPDDDNIKLADLLITSATTTITTSEITDERNFASMGTNIWADYTVNLFGGADYIFDLEDADSYVIVRDPSDTAQSLWVSRDGYGNMLPAKSTVAIGEAVYWNVSNTQLEEADADSSSTPAEAIVIKKPTSTTAVVTSAGLVQGLSGLTAGNIYYLSTTAGAITNTAPSGTGDIVQRVGRAKSTTELFVNIQNYVVLA